MADRNLKIEEYKDRTIIGLTEDVTLIGSNGKEKTVRARIDKGALTTPPISSIANTAAQNFDAMN